MHSFYFACVLCVEFVAITSFRLPPVAEYIYRERTSVELLTLEHSLSYRQRRSDDCSPDHIGVGFTADNKKVRLSLQRNYDINVNAPLVVNKNGRITQESLENSENVAVYQDLESGSAVLVQCIPGMKKFELFGTFYNGSEELMIEPEFNESQGEFLASSSYDVQSRNAKTNTEQVSQDQDLNEMFTISHHVIFKGKPIRPKESDFILKGMHSKYPASSGNSPRGKRATTAHQVEMLMVADYSAYSFWLNNSPSSVAAKVSLRQFYAFVLNGIDLRYKGITGAGFTITVLFAGLYIAETPSDALWTESRKNLSGTVYQVSAPDALEDFKIWIQNRQLSLPGHDHAMLFTAYDIQVNGNAAVAGLAYLGAVCTEYSQSIVEDNFDAQLMTIAAHELGHGLGASHDGTLDGTGNSCSPTLAYIMSASVTLSNLGQPGFQYNKNLWKFSPCSASYFQKYINTLNSTNCLATLSVGYNSSALSPYDQLNPGQVYSADLQCQYTQGHDSFLCRSFYSGNYSNLCTAFYCQISGRFGYCRLSIPAEKTTCGDKKWCVAGECVTATEAPSVNDGCPFGNTPGIVADGQTCSQLIASSSFNCYNYAQMCCESCQSVYTGIIGCEYGDKYYGCIATNCAYYSNVTRTACCKTCYVPPTTSSTNVTTNTTIAMYTTTTNPSTTIATPVQSTTAATTSSTTTTAPTPSTTTVAPSSSITIAIPTSSATIATAIPSTTTTATTSSTTTEIPKPNTTTAAPTPSTTIATSVTSTTTAPTSSTTTAAPTQSTTIPTPVPSTTTAAPTTSVTAASPFLSTTTAPTLSTTTASPISSTTNATPVQSTTAAAPTSSTKTVATTQSNASATPVPSTTIATPTPSTTAALIPSIATPTPALNTTTTASIPSTTIATQIPSTTTAAPTPNTTTVSPTSSTTNATAVPSPTTAASIPSTTTAAPTSSTTIATAIPSTTTTALILSITTASPTSRTTNATPIQSTMASTTQSTASATPFPSTTIATPTSSTTTSAPTSSTTAAVPTAAQNISTATTAPTVTSKTVIPFSPTSITSSITNATTTEQQETKKTAVTVRLNYNISSADNLSDSGTYSRYVDIIGESLRDYYGKKVGQDVQINIRDIRRGSLIVEYDVIIINIQTAQAALARANIDLAAGENITVGGQVSSVESIVVENKTVPIGSSSRDHLCTVYILIIGGCQDGYRCVVFNSSPMCQPITTTIEIVPVAVAAAVAGFVIAIAVGALLYSFLRRSKSRDKRLAEQVDDSRSDIQMKLPRPAYFSNTDPRYESSVHQHPKDFAHAHKWYPGYGYSNTSFDRGIGERNSHYYLDLEHSS